MSAEHNRRISQQLGESLKALPPELELAPGFTEQTAHKARARQVRARAAVTSVAAVSGLALVAGIVFGINQRGGDDVAAITSTSQGVQPTVGAASDAASDAPTHLASDLPKTTQGTGKTPVVKVPGDAVPPDAETAPGCPKQWVDQWSQNLKRSSADQLLLPMQAQPLRVCMYVSEGAFPASDGTMSQPKKYLKYQRLLAPDVMAQVAQTFAGFSTEDGGGTLIGLNKVRQFLLGINTGGKTVWVSMSENDVNGLNILSNGTVTRYATGNTLSDRLERLAKSGQW